MSETKTLGPAFNRLWVAFSSSKLGDGLMGAAAPLLAISLTKDTVLIALSGAMYLLPWLFFAIAIGTLVDRIDRKRTLVIVAVIRAVIAIALAWMIYTHTLNIYVLLLATFLIGTADVFNDTALQSLIPTILSKENLERGNSRFQMSDTVLGQFIGAPVGAILFVQAAFIPFGLDALGFAIAAILLILIPRKHIAKAEKRSEQPKFNEQLKDGIRFLRTEKRILRLVIATSLIGFGFNISNATTVLFVTETLGVPQAAFGALMLSGGVGALVGAFLAPKLSKRLGRGTVLSTSIFLTSVLEIAIGFAPNVWVLVALQILVGLAISGWNVLLMSTYHALIPNEVFGRVHGTRRTLVWGMMPIGAWLGGIIAGYGLRVPYLAGGLLAALVAGFYFRFIRQLGDASDNT